MNDRERKVLAALRKAEPKKKRVTFFISESVKSGLADWCKENNVTESGAIEEMIKATIPVRYFEREK